MFCTNCGKKNDDSALFCTECGQKILTAQEVEEAPVEEAPIQETPVEETPVEETPVEEAHVEETPVEEAPVEEVKTEIPFTPEPPKQEVKNTIGEEFKRFVRSPIVIIAVVLFTLYIVMSIVNAGSVASNLVEEVNDFVQTALEKTGDYEEQFDFEELIEEELGFAVKAIDDVFKTAMIVFMIPSIIICAGLWITLYGSFSKKGMPMPTVGITIIKVMNMISLIFAAIPFVSYVAATIYSLVQGSEIGLFSEMGGMAIAIALLMLLVAVILFLNLFYYIKINSTLKSFKVSVRRDTPYGNASKFVAVIVMISGGFQCLSALLSFSTIATWCGAIATILFSLIIFKYSSFLEYVRKQ